ncbi:ATP-binding protein [Variovorax sp. PCZ-1]|uniref:hybrid sensor histidine kinase/response regulator n=1 Tax=Variovorax sp. PCZ-1 TaxID=2835533 RepID=UPI001BD0973E|nr:ATP-binding protein [Variovorax sp. PCZ-1]MBS7807101.1 response regulator [Variovorax sp. PCZ-1]
MSARQIKPLPKADDADALWPIVRVDARTQAEVARIFFGNVVTGATVTLPSMAILAWLYHGTVDHAWLYSLIAFIVVMQILILLHWHRYSSEVQTHEVAGRWDWSVKQLQLASALSFIIIGGISALAVVIAQSSIAASPLIASVMVLTYLIGATVADFIHRPAVIGYPILLLGPMGILHATSAQPAQWAMAVFFLFYFFGVLNYSSMYSKRLQLSIYQRFELDALAQRLEGERERAQLAHDAKVRFFAATSHDVRQPLQAMSILLDAMRLQGADSEHRKRLIHDLDVNMDALRALFDQVLEVSRLQAGAVQLQPRPVRLADLFSRLQARFALQAINEGVRLDFGLKSAWVMADPLALERMVANLLGNALKHTPAGGAIWVGWRGTRGRIEVRDSGSGIASDEQLRIFDEFYQIEKSTDHSQGLGLGLAIVRRLAQLGGNSVGVRSALGQGSVFWLNLQATSEPLPQAELQATALPEIALPEVRGDLLYVENDATLLRLTSSLLRMNGWQVHAFADPQQALDWLSQVQHCDLLLTDFRMGELWDGAKLIEAARALPGLENLPVIVMTGDGAVAEVGSMRRLLSSAADEHQHTQITRLLHKPVKTAYLLEVISQSILRPVSA